MMKQVGKVAALLVVMLAAMLGGCATTGSNPIDPWEKQNRSISNFNDGLDKYLMKPVADAYVKVIPKEVRRGIGNGFDNLGYFDVILNDFLQGRWQQGCSDSGRMAVNSTVGVAGFFDVATRWGMPSHENDFGITLAKWKVERGPYLVLPLFGPSSCRDVTGIPVGMLDNPLTYVPMEWYVSASVSVVQAMDGRSRAEKYFKFRDVAALDKYVFTRDAYLQYRNNLIFEGKAPVDQGMYHDEDEDAATQPAATQPTATTKPASPPSAPVPPETPKPMVPH